MSNLISAFKAKQITMSALEKNKKENDKRKEKEVKHILADINDIINRSTKRGEYQVCCTIDTHDIPTINDVLKKLNNLGYECEYKNPISTDPHITISWE